MGDHGGMADRIPTIAAYFAAAVATRSDEPALGTIRGGELTWRTWRELWQDAQALAATERAAGVQPGDRVAQVSENRCEWIVTDLALHLLGVVHVPIHVTLSGEQIADQIATSGARLVFVSSAELLAKFACHLSHGETVIVHDEHAIGEDKPPLHEIQSPNVGGSAGASPSPAAPDDLATILFTSGTTGRPRGVMLSQRNLAWNAAAAADAHHDGTSKPGSTSCRSATSTPARAISIPGSTEVRGSYWARAARRSPVIAGSSSRQCSMACRTCSSGSPTASVRAVLRTRPRHSPVVFGDRMKLLVCGGAAVAPDVETWYADRGMPLLRVTD